jgi:hypothetical protein
MKVLSVGVIFLLLASTFGCGNSSDSVPLSGTRDQQLKSMSGDPSKMPQSVKDMLAKVKANPSSVMPGKQ